MKKRVISDVFDIVERVKAIDKSYFILYDTIRCVYELHSSMQGSSTYCLTFPYEKLDNRCIDLIHKTSRKNIDKILESMDRDNERLERNKQDDILDTTNQQFFDYYKYSNMF